MKKHFTSVKSLSAILIAMSVVSAATAVSVGATAANTGYDTMYSHVYSPMDLMDKSTTLGSATNTPILLNDTYDSSVWKFGIGRSTDGFFAPTTTGFAGPDVEAVAEGIKLSWNAVSGTDMYTVSIYKTDGTYSDDLMTTNTEITVQNISIGVYDFQIISDTGAASEVTTYKNIVFDTTMTAAQSETPVNISESGTAATVPQNNKVGDFVLNLDADAKNAFNADGAILLKYETNLSDGENITLNYPSMEDVTASSSDCWVGFHTFIYPTGADGKTLVTDEHSFYNNSGANQVRFTDLSGNSLYGIDMGYRGVHCNYYKGAVDFKNGYILIPLDDFDVDVSGGEYTYNLIDTVKQNGLLYVANTAKEYYYNSDGKVYKKSLTTEENLFDRSVTFSDVSIISDYSSYVSGNLVTKAEAGTHIAENGDFTITQNVTFPDNYVPFTANNYSSTYNFYCTTTGFTKSASNYRQRSIVFNAANGEQMMFGFTAPAAGTYEIAAPISATGSNVKYSVYKETANGNSECIAAEKVYTAAENFCDIMVELNAGDTVWLKASGDNGAIIDFGIPKAYLFNADGAVDGEDNSVTYRYRLMDYFEDTNSNDVTYGTLSTTENTTGAWNYGYFKYTADFGAKLSDFKNTSITLPNAATGVLDTSLLSAIKGYELIRSGNYYNANDLTAASTSTKDSGAGVMMAKSASSSLTETTTVSLGFHELGGTATAGATAYGHCFEFKAPTSGAAVLSNSTVKLANGVYMTIAVNDQIRTCTFASADANGDDVSLGELNAGDTVKILFYSFKCANESLDVGSPVISLTHTAEIVSGDANSDGLVNILDLIRAKKHLADSSVEISFEALNLKVDDVIDALDLAELKKILFVIPVVQ